MLPSYLQFLLDPFFVFKFLLLVTIFVFMVFMLVVLSQTRRMSKTVNQPKTPVVITVGVIILICAASLFLTSLVIL